MIRTRPSRSAGTLGAWVLSALVPAALLVLGPVAVTPSAAADDGDVHVELTLTLQEDDTIDMGLLVAAEGATRSDLEDSDTGCSASNFHEVADAFSDATFQIGELDGMPACDIRAPEMSLEGAQDLFNNDLTVTHSEGTYEVVLEEGFFDSAESSRFTLGFPGDVVSASGSGQVSGSSVTWEDPRSEGEIRASGADRGAGTASSDDAAPSAGAGAGTQDAGGGSATPTWLWILVAAVVVLVLAAGLVSLVLVRRRRRGVAVGQVPPPGHLPEGAPGAEPAAGQAGQSAAGFPQPLEPFDVSGQPGQVPPAAQYAPGQGPVPGGPQPASAPPSAAPGQDPAQGDYPPQWPAQ